MSNYLDVTIYDFDSICRTCLSREDLKSLYEKCSLSECPAEMLIACNFVKFTEDDGLPVKICTNCIHEIKQAFSFAKRCETTDIILRKCKTELANHSPQSQTVEAIEEITIKPEIISPNIHRMEDYKFVEEVKQEVDVKIEYVEEVKKEEELIIENEYNENYADPLEERCEEAVYKDQDEMYSKKSDNPGSKCRSTNSQNQMEGECSKEGIAGHSELNDQIYQCQTCDKSFKRLVFLKAHQTIHTAEKNDNEYDDTTNESYDQEETYAGSTPTRRSTNSQIEEESLKEEDGIPQSKKLDLWKQKVPANLPNQILSGDFTCTICNRAYATKYVLRRHSLIHGEKKFECSVCGRRFWSKASLNIHSKVHPGVLLHTCDVCRKTFRTFKNLESHKLTHTGEELHVCSVCSKAFAYLSQLKEHVIMHTGDKPHSCEVCGKSFSRNAGLTYHKRIHTGEKPFVCSVCSKGFTQSSSLKAHMRIHTGVKPYTCEICAKCFSTNQNLTIHKRIHTGEKPNVCSVCSKAFTYVSNLKDHMRRVHAGV